MTTYPTPATFKRTQRLRNDRKEGDLVEQSAASRELEEFARNVEGSYDDFVLFMGLIPQRKCVDEKLAQYVRDHPSATHDDVMYRYCEMAIIGRD